MAFILSSFAVFCLLRLVRAWWFPYLEDDGILERLEKTKAVPKYLPSPQTILSHSISEDPFWQQHAEQLREAMMYISEHDTLPSLKVVEQHVKDRDLRKIKDYLAGIEFHKAARVAMLTPSAA